MMAVMVVYMIADVNDINGNCFLCLLALVIHGVITIVFFFPLCPMARPELWCSDYDVDGSANANNGNYPIIPPR